MRAGVEPVWSAFLRAPRLALPLATAACLLAGCSSSTVTEYPGSIFPAVQDKPPQRADTPMTQVEVQKRTEDLISQRDRLNAQAPQQATQPAAQNGQAKAVTAKADTTGSIAKKTVHKRPAQQAAATPPATTASAQGAGMQAAGAQAAGADLKP
jgi:outer membrane biosynthesis protein TonB